MERPMRSLMRNPFVLLLLPLLAAIATDLSAPWLPWKYAPATVYRYDLTYTASLSPVAAYEECLFLSSLSGLVNRDGPILYTDYLPHDQYWLGYMSKRDFFNHTEEIKVLPDLDTVFITFADKVQGAVLFDPKVYATSNVASTAAGVSSLLPIAYRPEDPASLYSRYISTGRLQVKLDLVQRFNGSVTGSPKCDAYLWAIDTYVKTGLVNPAVMAFFIDYYWTLVPHGSGAQGEAPSYDLNTVVNRDYFVMQKAFFWDLNVWEDELPNDDPSQSLGTDLKTLLTLMQAYYDLSKGDIIITVGGFTPWKFKYVGGKHDGVATEWQTAMILTAYNALIDADACCIAAMANAAFYTHYPLPERLLQLPGPTPEALIAQGLLLQDPVTQAYSVSPNLGLYAFYVGDYDSAAWMYGQLYDKWNDPVRGNVPLGWALNPNLSKRFPLIFEMIYESLDPMDRITTGDSGAGYVDPTQFFEPRNFSNLPDGSAVWRQWCLEHYQRFDLTFTGFLLNGKAGHMTHQAQAFYTEFSWDGFTNHRGYSPDSPKVPSLEGNSPVYEEWDICGGDVKGAAQVIAGRYSDSGKGQQFMIFRSILQSPSYHKQVVEAASALNPALRAVDPLTLSYLARVYLGGNNNDRVSYIADTFPRRLKRDQVLENINFTIRNNGWNVLRLAASADNETTRVRLVGTLGNNIEFFAYGEEDVLSGQDGSLMVTNTGIIVPRVPGIYELKYGLRRASSAAEGDFSQRGNPDYVIKVLVE